MCKPCRDGLIFPLLWLDNLAPHSSPVNQGFLKYYLSAEDLRWSPSRCCGNDLRGSGLKGPPNHLLQRYIVVFGILMHTQKVTFLWLYWLVNHVYIPSMGDACSTRIWAKQKHIGQLSPASRKSAQTACPCLDTLKEWKIFYFPLKLHKSGEMISCSILSFMLTWHPI